MRPNGPTVVVMSPQLVHALSDQNVTLLEGGGLVLLVLGSLALQQRDVLVGQGVHELW